MMADAVHHMHIRKRVHQKFEPYPHPDKWKNLLDQLVFVVAFLGVILTLPQVYQVWFGKDISGISIISWSAYTLVACFWVVYGYSHRDSIIIAINSLFAVVNFLVVLGVLLHP